MTQQLTIDQLEEQCSIMQHPLLHLPTMTVTSDIWFTREDMLLLLQGPKVESEVASMRMLPSVRVHGRAACGMLS